MSNIKSEASPSEKNSPFYQNNLSICNEWGKFVAGNSGVIRGKITAWAFILEAKIKNASNWIFKVEKSTMSNGGLFSSSGKNQYLKTKVSATQFNLPQSFKIVRHNFITSIKCQLSSSTQKINDEYVLTMENDYRASGNNSLIRIFKNIDNKHRLEKLAYNHIKQELIISFDSVVMNFELLQNVLESGEVRIKNSY